MSILWCVAALAVVVAGVALAKARQASDRYVRLSESYWELRYQQGQLMSRLERVEAQLAGRSLDDEPNAPRTGSTAFVPLSSLKR